MASLANSSFSVSRSLAADRLYYCHQCRQELRIPSHATHLLCDKCHHHEFIELVAPHVRLSSAMNEETAMNQGYYNSYEDEDMRYTTSSHEMNENAASSHRRQRRNQGASSSSMRGSSSARHMMMSGRNEPSLVNGSDLSGYPFTRMVLNEYLGLNGHNLNGSVNLFNDRIEEILQFLVDTEGRTNADPQAVEQLPVVKHRVRVSGCQDCVICKEEFNDGEDLREMPCKHKFHNGCLLPWLKEKNSCPTCRYELPREGGD